MLFICVNETPIIHLTFFSQLVHQAAAEIEDDWRRQTGKEPLEKAKKKKRLKIDDLFADLENAFNGLSQALVWFEPVTTHYFGFDGMWTKCYIIMCDKARFLLMLPFLLITYALVSGAALLVVLPTCFVVLIARAHKVCRWHSILEY